MNALRTSNNLPAVIARKEIIEAQVIDTPKIVTQGLLSGSYAWKFQMPLLVKYALPPYDSQSQFTNALLVTVIVQRQKALESYQGLGILQLIASFAESNPSQPPVLSTIPTEQ